MTADDLILFVCTGNTCRSPMAEALWNAKFGRDIRARSAGVSAWSGQAAAAYAVEAVKGYGADLSDHRARDLTEVIESPQWVVTMTRGQAHRVRRLRPEWQNKIYLLSELADDEGDVHDPIGQSREAYQAVCDRLYDLLERLSGRIQE